MKEFIEWKSKKRVIFAIILVLSFVNLVFGLSAIFNPHVVINWKTETEIDTLGFNIYKKNIVGNLEFERVNSEIIIATGSSISGSTYSFIDRDVIPGETYIYELHEIQLDNQEKVIDQLEIAVKNKGYLLIGISIFLMVIPVLMSKAK